MEDLSVFDGWWSQDVPKNFRSKQKLYFKNGKVEWISMQMIDGLEVAGHSIIYNVRIDVASKRLSLFPIEKDLKNRVGIFELDGDVVKILFAEDENIPPKTINERPTDVYTFQRMK